MNLTIAHAMFMARKRANVSPESGATPVTIHDCIDGHTPGGWDMRGRPRNLGRLMDVHNLLRALKAMDCVKPGASRDHLYHLASMHVICGPELRRMEHAYQYAVGRRILLKMEKARKFTERNSHGN